MLWVWDPVDGAAGYDTDTYLIVKAVERAGEGWVFVVEPSVVRAAQGTSDALGLGLRSPRRRAGAGRDAPPADCTRRWAI